MTERSAVDERDLSVLRCPITLGPLRYADDEELDAARRHYEPLALDTVLVGGDRYVYAVADGIIHLLVADAFDLEGGAVPGLDPVKQGLRDFYDDVGWTVDDGDTFTDAKLFEDQRPVAAAYIHACHVRVGRHLPSRGRYLLDAASGPVQFEEYRAYGRNFEKRICVDLSRVALRQARHKLGDGGLYLLADITNLPLADATIDAALSLHTIYHVPADQQADAFVELHRVLAPGAPAVVVYSWGNPLHWRALNAPRGMRVRMRRAAARARARFSGAGAADTADALPKFDADRGPGFYFAPHDHRWFTQHAWPFTADVRVWRTVGVPFLEMYVHRWLGGTAFLRGLYRLEERAPHVLGRIGQYPLIVLRNDPARPVAPGAGPRSGQTETASSTASGMSKLA